jgi:hypothetical protein
MSEDKEKSPRLYTQQQQQSDTTRISPPAKKNGRGRPKGSKNRKSSLLTTPKTTPKTKKTTSLLHPLHPLSKDTPEVDPKIIALILPEAVAYATLKKTPMYYYRPSLTVIPASTTIVPEKQRHLCEDCIEEDGNKEILGEYLCSRCKRSSLCGKHARVHNMICGKCWEQITCFNCYHSCLSSGDLEKNIEIGTIRCSTIGCQNLLCYLDKVSNSKCFACSNRSEQQQPQRKRKRTSSILGADTTATAAAATTRRIDDDDE